LEYIKINNESILTIFDAESRENRFVPFFPITRFVGYKRRIERILVRESRRNLYNEIGMLIDGITRLFREIERSVKI